MISEQFGAGGQALWDAVSGSLDLDEHEIALLREAARTVDRLDRLNDAIEAQGLQMPDQRVNPAVMEARAQALTLARLIAAMRLPEDLANPAQRPQRRGPRGVYQRVDPLLRVAK